MNKSSKFYDTSMFANPAAQDSEVVFVPFSEEEFDRALKRVNDDIERQVEEAKVKVKR